VFVTFPENLARGQPTGNVRRAVNRILAALQGANFGTVTDESPASRDRFNAFEDLLKSMESWDAAVCVLAPQFEKTAYPDAGLSMLAYRLWTRPDFPLALFYTGSNLARAGLPEALRAFPFTDLDPLSDPQLQGQLQSRLSLTESPDEDGGTTNLIAAMSVLLETPDGTPISGVHPQVSAIMASGKDVLPGLMQVMVTIADVARRHRSTRTRYVPCGMLRSATPRAEPSLSRRFPPTPREP
jgi:hypothetical protein